MNKLITVKEAEALSNVEVTKALVESPDFAAQYALLKETYEALKAVKETVDGKIRDMIAPMYEEDGTSKVSNTRYNYTYVAPTTSATVDTDKLKKEFPEVYKQCIKTNSRKATVKVTEVKTVGDKNE